MTRRPLLAAAAVAFTTFGALAACSDRPAQPTAPRAPVVPAAAAVVTGAPPAGASTVCLAYSARISVVKEKIEKAQERHAGAEELAALQGHAEKLAEMAADACN